jgi:hypothetical protein
VLLNRLDKLRSAARYLEGHLDLTGDEARTMLEVTRDMLAAVRMKVPERRAIDDHAASRRTRV